MMNKLIAVAVLPVVLVACDGGVKLAKNLSTLLGAAEDHPCAAEFAYQSGINGVAADTRAVSNLVEGDTQIIEQHWYSGLSLVAFYQYSDDGSWCNTWTESGVMWVN